MWCVVGREVMIETEAERKERLSQLMGQMVHGADRVRVELVQVSKQRIGDIR